MEMQQHGKCGGMAAGGAAKACNTQNTKLLELRFCALLDEAGAQQIELARA
jgi:hypothetical protein